MISPVLTGVKEDDSVEGRKKLDLNLNERSAASITDDNTLLDAPNTATRMTATKISQQDLPLNHDPPNGPTVYLFVYERSMLDQNFMSMAQKLRLHAFHKLKIEKDMAGSIFELWLSYLVKIYSL